MVPRAPSCKLDCICATRRFSWFECVFNGGLLTRHCCRARYFVTGSKDMTARIYSVDPTPGFIPITLAAHRSSIVGAAFSADGDVVYTSSKDAALFTWTWTARPELPSSALAVVKADSGGDGDGDDRAGGSELAVSSRLPGSRGAAAAVAKRTRNVEVPNPRADAGDKYSVLVGEWRLTNRHFFKQDGAKVWAHGGGCSG